MNFPLRLVSAKSLGGSPVVLNLYSEDVDTLFDQAVRGWSRGDYAAGNQFWGDRYGQITDPFGHRWALGQHVEDVAPKRWNAAPKRRFADGESTEPEVISEFTLHRKARSSFRAVMYDGSLNLTFARRNQ